MRLDYIKHKIANLLSINKIVTIHYYELHKNFNYDGESHNFWEIFAVTSGEVEVVEDERTYHMVSGDVICHAPGEFHRLKSAGETTPRSMTICFLNSGELPERISEGVFHMPKEMTEEFTKMKDVLLEALGGNFEGGYNYYNMAELGLPSDKQLLGMEAISRLTAFVLSVAKLTPSEKSLSRSASAMEYRKLVRTMTERVRDNLSLKDLADIHHISESYVKKLFHTYAGEGAMVYYGRLRTSEIKRLLDEGLSVSEITERMNFSSASYLSTFFKKQTGITPCAYAEKGSGKPKKLL